MNHRLLVPVLTAAALLACAGEEEQAAPEPTATPAARPAPASPRGMTATDYWFRGVVSDMNTGCYVDAICSVTVEVTEGLGGEPLEKANEIVVIESYGFSIRRCDGQWAETPPGHEVEVLAHATETDTLAVCEGEHYFVKDLQAPE